MRHLAILLYVLLTVSIALHGGAVAQDYFDRFAVYYSDQAPPDVFKPYQLIILDQKHHPPLQPLTENGKLLLGYISLGEVEGTSPWFANLKQKGMILQE